MIVIYFETPNGSYCEEIASFKEEELFIKCFPILEREAKKQRMIITEKTKEEK